MNFIGSITVTIDGNSYDVTGSYVGIGGGATTFFVFAENHGVDANTFSAGTYTVTLGGSGGESTALTIRGALDISRNTIDVSGVTMRGDLDISRNTIDCLLYTSPSPRD